VGWLGFFIALTFALVLMGVRPLPAMFLLAVFGGTWLFFAVFSRVVRAILTDADDSAGQSTNRVTCGNTHCRRVNEAQARYCAHCGQRLTGGARR
jgi:hypothetical protein